MIGCEGWLFIKINQMPAKFNKTKYLKKLSLNGRKDTAVIIS